MTIKVGVLGALGKVGREICAGVEAAEGVELVARIDVGDSLDGGKVAAITDSEVRYQKGGRMVALSMPKG